MQKYYGWGLPADISTHGYEIDRLINLLHVFMIVLFLGWFLFLLYLVFRFRERPGHKTEAQVPHFKLPTYLEVGIAAFEVLLLCAFSFPIWHKVRAEFPARDKSVEVRIVAEQFAWNIHYPGPDGKFGRRDGRFIDSANTLGLDSQDPDGQDDVVTLNEMHVPLGKPTLVYLSAKDVIHSFFVPEFRVKQDAMPGMELPFWFEPTIAGKFEIACSQLCGIAHANMRGDVYAHSPEDYQAWLKSQASGK
jgi:cytochrome c oxidase subunit 2